MKNVSTIQFALIGGAIGIFIHQYYADVKWESFSKQHNCKLTTKIETVWNLPEEGFVCDDGITYYR